ncbi:MAG: hypothetical protein ACRC46_07330 [Thermoguttaceae bacterium]
MSSFSHEQAERFIEHLTKCHSWYKHIPLLEGSEFFIVIDPNAGRNYAEVHPCLPFGNSQEAYQKAFGLLNYYHNCGADDLYFSDCHDSTSRPDEPLQRQDIVRRFPHHQTTRLFPYISWEFSDVLTIWNEGVDKIVQGFEHESKGELIRLRDAILHQNRFWQNEMSDDERQKYDGNKLVTVNQNQYKLLEDTVSDILNMMRTVEVEKIRRAVEELQDD